MRTARADAMIKSRMWSDESQFERNVASNFVTFMCVATSIRASFAANGPLQLATIV